MVKKGILTAFIVVAGYAFKAQQDYQFTHYMYDKLSFNPGYSGINNAICGTLLFREQWAGFVSDVQPGNPTTAIVNVHAPVSMLRGGVGLSYANDRLGFVSGNLARLSYSYHLGLNGGTGMLGLGLSVGILQQSVKATWITPDGTPYTDDNAINVAEGSDMVPDFNLGAFYKSNNLYMGMSVTHLVRTDLKDLNIQNVQHMWVVAGYDHDLNQDFKLQPNVLLKTDFASTQLDLNVTAKYKNMVWAGLSYRLNESVSPMVGYETKVGEGTLRIGYAYDVLTSQIRKSSSGSHDIMLNYCFSLDKPPVLQKSKNPRFL